MRNLAWGSFHNDPIKFIPEEYKDLLLSSLPEGYLLCSIDGREINSRQELLSNLAKSMKFPDYFGGNWDALNDCLSDLAWLPARGYVIYFSNADSFINNRPSDFKTFLEIVRAVSAFWAEQQVEFVVIIESKAEPN